MEYANSGRCNFQEQEILLIHKRGLVKQKTHHR